ncbi:hypothetical protein LCGC14_2309460, partial [marine sediment metagenome]
MFSTPWRPTGIRKARFYDNERCRKRNLHLRGNGRSQELPGIHKILAPVIDYQAPDFALNRGRLVHRALEIIDKNEGGGLHMDSLHPELRPRVEAYLDFKEHTSLK